MFAARLAETETVAHRFGVARQPSAPVTNRHTRGPFEQVYRLQQTVGNQATQRLLTRLSLIEAGTVRRVHLDVTGRRQFDCADFVGDKKLEACLNDEDRLGPGDRGPTVGKVQKALIKDGEDLGPLGADEKYGSATGQAVKAFKKKYSLGFEQFPDVGPGTMAKLDQLCVACKLVCPPGETLDPVKCACIPGQKPNEPSTCGPDITDWFVKQVNTAAADKDVLGVKRALSSADFFARIGGTTAAEIGEAGATAAVLNELRSLGSAAPAFTGAAGTKAAAQIAAGKTSLSNVAGKLDPAVLLGAIPMVTSAALLWKGLVETGARYDFKNNVLNHPKAAGCPQNCDEGEVGIVTLCPGSRSENCYEADVPGNLFYAAIGRFVGWSELALQLGSQLAELKDITITKFHPAVEWDPPTDTAAIMLGFRALPVPLTRGDLCGIVPKVRGALNIRRGCPDCATAAALDIK